MFEIGYGRFLAYRKALTTIVQKDMSIGTLSRLKDVIGGLEFDLLQGVMQHKIRLKELDMFEECENDSRFEIALLECIGRIGNDPECLHRYIVNDVDLKETFDRSYILDRGNCYVLSHRYIINFCLNNFNVCVKRNQIENISHELLKRCFKDVVLNDKFEIGYIIPKTLVTCIYDELQDKYGYNNILNGCLSDKDNYSNILIEFLRRYIERYEYERGRKCKSIKIIDLRPDECYNLVNIPEYNLKCMKELGIFDRIDEKKQEYIFSKDILKKLNKKSK